MYGRARSGRENFGETSCTLLSPSASARFLTYGSDGVIVYSPNRLREPRSDEHRHPTFSKHLILAFAGQLPKRNQAAHVFKLRVAQVQQ